MHTLPNCVNCLDYQQAAEQHFLDQQRQAHWRYIHGVSGDGLTANANTTDFDNIQLRPRVLSGNVQPDLSTTLLGKKVNSPLLLAPVSYQKLADESGEIGAIQAAMAQEVGFCLSTLASSTLEDVSHYADGNSALIFQLYPQADVKVTLDLIGRAQNSGYQAIMITVDAPINGLRYHEARDKFSLPESVRAANLTPYDKQVYSGLSNGNNIAELMKIAPSWQDINHIIGHTRLPVILKGIINERDAIAAKEVGAKGIVVSNHGGRILDGVPSAISQLPKIRHALGDDYPILFDSGIRRGSDIYKALALGADAVMLGRPFMYALSVAGPLGVAHLLRLLKDELLLTMALMGNSSIESITSEQVLVHT